jgi:hypothetical protein
VHFHNHAGDLIKTVEGNEGDDIVDLAWEWDVEIEGPSFISSLRKSPNFDTFPPEQLHAKSRSHARRATSSSIPRFTTSWKSRRTRRMTCSIWLSASQTRSLGPTSVSVLLLIGGE